ncbi:MAG: type II secretion system F family protein [bacterium]|nr:type II secretion system F family protein [bacterium]
MQFVCTVGKTDGRIVEESHDGRSEAAVRAELERRGHHVLKIRRRGLPVISPLAWSSNGRRAKKVPDQALLLFNQEFAALLRSGLPVLQGLGLMADRQRDPVFKEILEDVVRKVQNGSELSAAFAHHGESLPQLFPATLKAGERSGELESVIRRFVRYMKLITEARRKVVSALVYPAVLVGLSLLLIAVMAVYVVPKFTEFFSALDTELPLLTRMTLSFSRFMSNNWLVLLAGTTIVVVVVGRVSRSPAGGRVFDRLKLKVPILGSIFRRLAMSEFSRSLSTLLAGGIPVVPALEDSVSAVGNAYIRRVLEPMIPKVREGVALYSALEASGESPEIVVEMTKVGEETGSLDLMLGNASDFLDEEVDTLLQRILVLVEPIMLVLMGTIVATLLVSVYLPLFSMLSQVGPR